MVRHATLTSSRFAAPDSGLRSQHPARLRCRHSASRKWECSLALPAAPASPRGSHAETTSEMPRWFPVRRHRLSARPDQKCLPFHRRTAQGHAPVLEILPCTMGRLCPPDHALALRLDVCPPGSTRAPDSAEENTAKCFARFQSESRATPSPQCVRNCRSASFPGYRQYSGKATARAPTLHQIHFFLSPHFHPE